MKTLHPVAIRGRATLDQNLLTPDEFQRRITSVQEKMKAQSLDSLLVFGSAGDYGDLCYLTSFVPFLRFGVAIIPSSGEPAIMMNASARDLAFQRSLTIIRDVRAISDVAAQARKVLDDRGITLKRIGHVGGTTSIPASMFERVAQGLQDINIVDATDLVRKMRQKKSPREIEALRRSHACSKHAVEVLAESRKKGMTNFGASVEAERTALMDGAQDARAMINQDEEASSFMYPPNPEMPHAKNALAYIATEYLGYWSEDYYSSGDNSLATSAVDAMINEVREGIPCSELANVALHELHGAEQLAILEGSFGNGIGLSSLEEPSIISGSSSHARLERDMVLSLRVGVKDEKNGGVSIASEMVLVRRDGSERI